MTLLYLVVGIVLLAYVGMPLLIKTTLKINARPTMSPASPRDLEADVRAYLDACAPKLSVLRFEQAALFTAEQATPGVTSHVALWINRSAGQAAAATVMISRGGDKRDRVKRYVEFLTRVQAGVSVTTNNSSELGAFKQTAASDTLSAQHVPDLSHLYRLHLWRDRQIAGTSAPRCLPAAGDELTWFANLFEESIKRQLDTGYLQFAGDGIYVPTTQGAYLMTWGELPPMKSLRRRSEDKRAEKQVEQAAAVPVTPPPATIRIVTDTPRLGGSHRPPMRNVA